MILALALFPIVSFAADTNFISIFKNDTVTVYMDMNNIQVIRYEPPYYIIQEQELHKNFGKGLYGTRFVQYFYDYNKQTIKMKYLQSYTNDGTHSWNEDEYLDTSIREVPKDTAAYMIANYAFYKSYGMFFSKELQEKYGTFDPIMGNKK